LVVFINSDVAAEVVFKASEALLFASAEADCVSV